MGNYPPHTDMITDYLSPRLRSIIGKVLPLVGMVLMLFWSWQNTADLPKYDDLPTVGRPLLSSLDGTLTFRELNEQIVDNRMLVVRVIHVALARLTHWNVRAETMLSVLLGGCTVLVLAGIARRTWPEGGWRPFFLAMLAGVTWFSLSGGMIWIYGPFFCHVLTPFLMLTIAWVGLTRLSVAWRFWLGVLLAVLATNSFVYGWLCWGLLGWQLLGWRLDHKISLKQFAGYVAAAVVLMALLAKWYFTDYEVAGKPGLLGRIMHDPMRYLNFFLQWLGSGIGNPWPYLAKPVRLSWQYSLAWWSGLLVLLLGMWAVWRVWRERPLRTAAWPWLGMALWGLLGGVLVTVGRAELSAEAAFWPRYQLLVYLVYLALVTMILLVLRPSGSRWRWLGGIPALLAIVGWINGSLLGWVTFRGDYFSSQSIHGALILNDVAPNPVLLDALFPGDYQRVEKMVNRLSPMGYFRPGILTDERVASAKVVRGGPYQGELKEGEIKPDGSIELEGWAVKTKLRCPVDAIVLSVQAEGGDEVWWTVATNRKPANKQATKLKLSVANSRIGWALGPDVSLGELVRKPLPAGKLTFRAYALEVATLTFYPLEGEFLRP
jgi:hypothetical protein